MAKGAEAFRSIGEVAKLIGVAPHVLRYWETQFSLLKPVKRSDGRRYYRPDDVRLAAGICEILRDEGLTIRGAKKLLAKDRGESVRGRGAQKLGEALEVATEISVRPSPVAAVQPDHRPAVEATNAAALAEEDEPARGLRSRNRKRPAQRGPETLPLFPDEVSPAAAAAPVASARPIRVPVDPLQAGWLGELSRVGQLLRGYPRGGDLSRPARAGASRLLDAIADHY